jgi:hypothetical protein
MDRYYCLRCDKESNDETCIDCGDVGDLICPTCDEVLDNCNCEVSA